jgi:ribose-phosphate pyrophosphokinase
VISPDAGGVERARAFAALDGALAVIDKRRSGANEVAGDAHHRQVRLASRDPGRRHGRIPRARCANAAQAAIEAGAHEVIAACTHACAVRTGGSSVSRSHASARSSSPTRSRLGEKARACSKVKVLSVAQLIGEAIRCTHNEERSASLFI